MIKAVNFSSYFNLNLCWTLLNITKKLNNEKEDHPYPSRKYPTCVRFFLDVSAELSLPLLCLQTVRTPPQNFAPSSQSEELFRWALSPTLPKTTTQKTMKPLNFKYLSTCFYQIYYFAYWLPSTLRSKINSSRQLNSYKKCGFQISKMCPG